MVYTAMLNERGGFESDLTITRLGADTFFILTGSAQATRDADWINRHIGDEEFAALVDVTSAYSVISVMGPKAAALLARVSSDDLSGKDALPFSATREIDVGYARVRAARMSYIGGPGYELYVTTDQCVTMYDALQAAGSDLGLRDAGYYTIDALRIEAGRRAWGAELGPDETPWEAGLGVRGQARQGRRLHRQGGAAAPARARSGEAAADIHARRPDGVSLGRRTDPDGRPERRRADLGGLQPRARTGGRDGLRARRDAARRRRALAARYEIDIAGEKFAATPHLKLI